MEYQRAKKLLGLDQPHEMKMKELAKQKTVLEVDGWRTNWRRPLFGHPSMAEWSVSMPGNGMPLRLTGRW